jgi:hypothetical protein
MFSKLSRFFWVRKLAKKAIFHKKRKNVNMENGKYQPKNKVEQKWF